MPKFPFKSFGKIGLTVAGIMVPQIAQAEAAFRGIKTGPDKKKAVLDAVTASIDLSEALSGQEIADAALLMEGLSQINDGFVKVMRAVEPPKSSVELDVELTKHGA